MDELERAEMRRLQHRHDTLQFQVNLLRTQLERLEKEFGSAAEREQLGRLKERWELLHGEFDHLRSDLERYEARLAEAEQERVAQAAEARQTVLVPPPILAPPISPVPMASVEPVQFAKEQGESVKVTAVPPPLPKFALPIKPEGSRTVTPVPAFESPAPSGEEVPAPVSETVFARERPALESEPAFASQKAARVTSPVKSGAPAKESSFEMRLGTYWLVRIGIVMLLTGLAFLGNYAYRNFIGLLGPVGKASLLYLASGALLGAGAWLQRKSQKDSLKNYGQVLFAGGLAGVYFTTYAAHYFENLRFITSAVLDGALLLGWAGVIVWIADRWKSEVMALFAIGLAYYTSIITQVGMFTLYSSLVLTAAAVFFLMRNRWATLTFASLVATYAGFAFWRFWEQGDVGRYLSTGELWRGNGFLAAYWLLFTAATFLSRNEKMSGGRRATFLSANNGAVYGLVLLSMRHVSTGRFWQFSLGFGAVLLVLAWLSRRVLPGEKIAGNSYLTQGVVLMTVGLIAKFSGLDLALLLAAESVVLLVLGGQLNNRLLRAGACLTGFLSAGWGVLEMHKEPRLLALGIGAGTLLLFNAWWSQRRQAEAGTKFFRLFPSLFTLLALVLALATAWHNATPEWRGPVLALMTLALTAACYGLKLRELAVFSQIYLLLAQVFYFVQSFQPEVASPWWNPVVIITVTVALGHWWQRQTLFAIEQDAIRFAQLIMAAACVGLTFVWLHPQFQPGPWLAFTSLLAAGLTVYGIVTRAWYLAVGGQFFLLVSAGEFIQQLLHGRPEWYLPLVPLAIFLGTGFAVALWIQQRKDTASDAVNTVSQISRVYRWVAVAMTLGWVCEYVPDEHLAWSFALLGLAVSLLGSWRRSVDGLLAGSVFFVAALSSFAVLLLRPQTPAWHLMFAPVTILLAASLALHHWFSNGAVPDSATALTPKLVRGYVWTALGMFLWWVYEYVPVPHQAWLYALLGTVVFVLAGWRRHSEGLWQGTVLFATGLVCFARLILQTEPPPWHLTLLPIFLLLATSFLMARSFNSDSAPRDVAGTLMTQFHIAFCWAALAATVGWVFAHIPAREEAWVFTLLGAVVFGFIHLRASQQGLASSAILLGLGLTVFVMLPMRELSSAYLPNLLAILAVPALQVVARRSPRHAFLPSAWHTALMVAGGLCLWLYVSRAVEEHSGGTHFYLTASWALLALIIFVAGFGLGERIYRWQGLGILACSVVRVFASDVWKLKTIYQILSVISLGVVLLLLGFIYNKYQDRIKAWL